MNASQDLQTSGNNSFPSRAIVVSSNPRDLQGIGLFSSGPVYNSAHRVPRQEGTALFEHYERDMRAYQVEHHAALEDVRRKFVLPSDEPIVSFLNEHRGIAQLLIDAAAPLKHFFGEDTIFSLRLPADDLGSPTIYAVVIWAGTVLDVRHKLQEFDDSWWFEHLPQAAGHLSFTYELI